MLILKNYLLIIWFNKILFYTLNKHRKKHEF